MSGANEVSSERLVYKYMMEAYNPSVRPVRNDSDTVDLHVDLHLHLLQDLVSSTWLFVLFVSLLNVKN